MSDPYTLCSFYLVVNLEISTQSSKLDLQPRRLRLPSIPRRPFPLPSSPIPLENENRTSTHPTSLFQKLKIPRLRTPSNRGRRRTIPRNRRRRRTRLFNLRLPLARSPRRESVRLADPVALERLDVQGYPREVRVLSARRGGSSARWTLEDRTIVLPRLEGESISLPSSLRTYLLNLDSLLCGSQEEDCRGRSRSRRIFNLTRRVVLSSLPRSSLPRPSTTFHQTQQTPPTQQPRTSSIIISVSLPTQAASLPSPLPPKDRTHQTRSTRSSSSSSSSPIAIERSRPYRKRKLLDLLQRYARSSSDRGSSGRFDENNGREKARVDDAGSIRGDWFLR